MCKFCSKQEKLEVYHVTDDDTFQEDKLYVQVWPDGSLGIDGEAIQKISPDGLSIEIDFCPMCGRRLGVEDDVAKSIGFRNYSHMIYNKDNWSKEYLVVVNALLAAYGLEELD